ncbi:hypothetical protein [Acetobacter syzygii]|uniref:hypothetical protein n=1 Tax=Acetobacter syzygii TaxID=146476 RepID=UPI0015714B94|nr:hypothetical protein [Acetobacter syzygii]NSL93738.1 hypothetical protein [Acetobacter syzygii]
MEKTSKKTSSIKPDSSMPRDVDLLVTDGHVLRAQLNHAAGGVKRYGCYTLAAIASGVLALSILTGGLSFGTPHWLDQMIVTHADQVAAPRIINDGNPQQSNPFFAP